MAKKKSTTTAAAPTAQAADAIAAIVEAGAVQVHAKRDSFRRAGFAFGSEPVTLNVEDLDEEQLQAIVTEPLLVAVPTKPVKDEAAA